MNNRNILMDNYLKCKWIKVSSQKTQNGELGENVGV